MRQQKVGGDEPFDEFSFEVSRQGCFEQTEHCRRNIKDRRVEGCPSLDSSSARDQHTFHVTLSESHKDAG